MFVLCGRILCFNVLINHGKISSGILDRVADDMGIKLDQRSVGFDSDVQDTRVLDRYGADSGDQERR